MADCDDLAVCSELVLNFEKYEYFVWYWCVGLNHFELIYEKLCIILCLFSLPLEFNWRRDAAYKDVESRKFMISAIWLVHFAKLTFLWNPGHRCMPTVRTAKHLLLESTTKSVESGTNDLICQFCTVKGMVVETEILKALCCALSK